VAVSRVARQAPPLIEQRLDDVFGQLRRTPAQETTPAVVAAGVIIDRAGIVLTEYLAVREGDDHIVTSIDGKSYPASIHAADPRSGLAVLAIAQLPQRTDASNAGPVGSFHAIRMAENGPLRKGQFVVAVGNPFAIESGGQPTASWGIVTNLASKAPPGTNFNSAPGPSNDYRTTVHHLGTLIQTDAKLGWSAGGGALVNLRGEMIGLTTTVATIAGHEQPAGYAIPTGGPFRRIIETLKQGREVEYGVIGVGFGLPPFEFSAGRSQLSVTQVYPGSPAARAGLEVGDVLTRVGDRPVDDVDVIQLLISSLPPATTANIEYERRGRPGRTTVTLAKLGVAGKKIATVRPDAWRGIRVDYATALDSAALTEAIESRAYDPEGCVLVTEVEPKSVAWNAGVRPGMFISHAGGKRVTTPEEFRAAVRNVGERFDIRLTQAIEPSPANAPPGDDNPP
jgi:S1-C subfamily serine protease